VGLRFTCGRNLLRVVKNSPVWSFLFKNLGIAFDFVILGFIHMPSFEEVFSLGKVKSWKVTEIFSANRSEEGIRL
jgi:hypothetical protein